MAPGTSQSPLDPIRQARRDGCGRFDQKRVESALFGYVSMAARTVCQMGDEPLALLSREVMGEVVIE
jgi:hypothetical protein